MNKRIALILAATVAVLLIPFIAMQFTNDVSWGSEDFLVAGVLLFGTGLLVDFVLRKVKSRSTRMIAIALIIIALVLVWVELAVGIFGTPFAGN